LNQFRFVVALLFLIASTGLQAVEIVEVPFQATQLWYSPSTQRLYALGSSVDRSHPDSLLSIDPRNGASEEIHYSPEGFSTGALSSDGGYFYLSAGYPFAFIRRINLRTKAVDLQFSLGTYPNTDTPLRAASLAPVPGSPESVAVLRGSNRGGVVLYDNGIPRPHTAFADRDRDNNGTLFFGANGSRLYYEDDTSLWRLAVDAEGVSGVEEALNLTLKSLTLQFGDGRVYTESGQVFDPEADRILGNYSRYEIDPSYSEIWGLGADPSSDRVYALGSDPFGNRTLWVFDKTTFRLLSAVKAPGPFYFDPGRPFPLGKAGIAFIDQKSVLLLHSPLLFPAPQEADLSVSPEGVPDSVTAGEPVSCVFTVHNRGRERAEGVTVTDALPTGLRLLSATASQGACQEDSSQITCDLGPLDPQAEATLALRVRSESAGSFPHEMAVTSATPDSVNWNDRASQTLRVRDVRDPHKIRQMDLFTNDLLFDPRSNRLYASLSGFNGPQGNTVAAIDPITGKATYSEYLGSEPSQLAITDDGQYLYVFLYGSQEIRRLQLPSMKSDLVFPTYQWIRKKSEQDYLVLEALDLETVPEHPETVVLLRRGQHKGVVALYDNGVLRPDYYSGKDPFPYDSMTLQSVTPISSTRLLGIENYAGESNTLYDFQIQPTGIHDPVSLVKWLFGSRSSRIIVKEDGRLFTFAGEVVDLGSLRRVGAFYIGDPTLSGDPQGNLLPDESLHRAYFIGGKSPKLFLRTFDTRTYQPVGTLPISNTRGQVIRLVRWGSDGLAFNTDGGQLFICQTPFVETEAAAADLSVTQTAPPVTQSASDTITFTIDVKNEGASPAKDVLVVDHLPPASNWLYSVPGNAQFSSADQTVRFRIDEIDPGAHVRLTVTVQPITTGPHRNQVSVSSTTFDPDDTNNQATDWTAVADTKTPYQIRILTIPNNDFIFDAKRQLFYVSLPSRAGWMGNRILILDPVTGERKLTPYIGSEPDRLGISDDGEDLYVQFRTTYRAIRFHLPLLPVTPELDFGLGLDYSGNPYRALAFQSVPGRSHSVLVTLGQQYDFLAEFAANAVFDEGVMRPKRITEAEHVQFSATPSLVYGMSTFGGTLYSIRLDASGLTIDSQINQPMGSLITDFESSNGLLFAQNGSIYDPLRKTLLSTPFYNGESFVQPDPDGDLVHYLIQLGYNESVLETYAPYGDRRRVEASAIPGTLSKPTKFFQWKKDGYLIRTASDQLILVTKPGSPLRGDVDMDGRVTLRDIQKMIEWILFHEILTNGEFVAGDTVPDPGIGGRFRGDGRIGMDDLNWTLRRCLGLVKDGSLP
jgi:uncharacterized repeat protein (TIGR01451 family)